MLGNDIQIKQLVGVGDVHLSFQPAQRVYCLIGENGIGKTKCLEALFSIMFCIINFLSKTNYVLILKINYLYHSSLLTTL